MTTCQRQHQLADARRQALPLRFNRHTGGYELDRLALIREGRDGRQLRRPITQGRKALARTSAPGLPAPASPRRGSGS